MHREWRPEGNSTSGNPNTAPIPGRKKLAEPGVHAGLSAFTAATVVSGIAPSAGFGAASGVERIQPGDRAVGGCSGEHGAGSVDPFNAIDRGTPAVRGTVAAAQRSLSVGYQDPVLGYVELRASVKSNGLHAALTTVTEGARDSLGAQMGGLHDWMITRHIPLTSLGVMASGTDAESASADRLESRSGGRGLQNSGQGSEMHSGSGEQLDHRGGRDPESRRGWNPRGGFASAAAPGVAPLGGTAVSDTLLLEVSSWSGSRISVVA